MSKQNSNYMGSGLAQTLDQKPNKDGMLSKGLGGSTSEASLAISTYSVPSLDGKSLIPAIPKHLALKFKPPTLAVVYQMKDAKSGKMKKYIHEIKIKFEEYEPYPGGRVDVGKMCDELCRKETVYLHPACISRKQVQNFINQLHARYIQGKEGKAAESADQNQDPNFNKDKGRKLNFMERKRFVNYEENDAVQKAADKEEALDLKAPAPTKEIRDGKIVESNDAAADAFEENEVVTGGKKRPKKAEAVKSAAPKKKDDKDDKKQDTKPEDSKQEDASKNKDSKEKKKTNDEFDLDGYSDDWGNGSSDDNKAGGRNQQVVQNVVVQPTVVVQPAETRSGAAGSFPPKLDMGLNNQVAQGASEDKGGNLDNYSDDKWDDDDVFDNNKQKQNDNNLNALNFHQDKEANDNFYGFANDNNSSPNDDNKMFDNEFDDLEKEFNQNQQNDMNDDKLANQFGSNKNPFGNSITKELLVKSKQDIEDELGKDIFEDNKNTQADDLAPNNTFNKKNLEIDIDETVPFDLENENIQQQLNNKLMENESKQAQMNDNNAQPRGQLDGGDPNGSPDGEGSEIEMTEAEILVELDNLNHLVNTDPELNKMLANDIEGFGLEEKLMIIQAYKKGGVQGVKDIIEEEEEEADPQQQQNNNNNQASNGGQNGNGNNDEDEDEEVEIDLENEEDIKIIEDQFLQMVNSDERFRTNFGDEIFQLGPIQKYQIIDAYKQNGMEAVLVLLTESADQSGLQMDANGQSDMMGMENAGEESVIEHNGKKFQRVQIEGVGDGDDEYLMEIDTGDIYSLDFQFMSHMGDDVVIEEN